MNSDRRYSIITGIAGGMDSFSIVVTDLFYNVKLEISPECELFSGGWNLESWRSHFGNSSQFVIDMNEPTHEILFLVD